MTLGRLQRGNDMRLTQRAALGLCGLMLFSATSVGAPPPQPPAREHGGRYTAERLANARANCDKHEWAATLRKTAVTRAAPWLARSDLQLWSMVPGQDL